MITDVKNRSLKSRTLFSLIFGHIAESVKDGVDPFRSVDNMTLGMEPDVPGVQSTLICDKGGNWFRLTVEPVTMPDRKIIDTRWPRRVETD